MKPENFKSLIVQPFALQDCRPEHRALLLGKFNVQ